MGEMTTSLPWKRAFFFPASETHERRMCLKVCFFHSSHMSFFFKASVGGGGWGGGCADISVAMNASTLITKHFYDLKKKMFVFGRGAELTRGGRPIPF